MYCYSVRVNVGRFVRGIYEIALDSTTAEYVSYRAGEWAPHVRNIGHDAASGTLIVSTQDDIGFEIHRVRFSDATGFSTERLVEPAWEPWGAAAWPGHSGVVFYGLNPSDGTRGFYWRRSVAPSASIDSLLGEVILTPDEAATMSIGVDGGYLFFAQGREPVRFYALNLADTFEGLIVVAQRNGRLGAIIPHPTQPTLALLRYSFPGDALHVPGDHVEVLDLLTGQARELDVRTKATPGYFVICEHLSWSPDGRNFVFSGSSFSGEQDFATPTLWVYQDVPLP
jgi:hypothetical protein